MAIKRRQKLAPALRRRQGAGVQDKGRLRFRRQQPKCDRFTLVHHPGSDEQRPAAHELLG